MSALGQKQTFAVQKAMSALPLKAQGQPRGTVLCIHNAVLHCLKAHLGFARGHIR